ncbi:hypothetical protein K435DRAFT_813712 [Dendrothele bispora CBS 962.96]|uniref:Uncharacterized protein n=1 Tax=Dendrothele bispora (strain CBS 962.96) TaxID=1314807 RepID=A0A4S8KKU5_DENBC|nr:hypothetical protein K435DRAFT_813712 [Dendrothele bispora CBS 962.96]
MRLPSSSSSLTNSAAAIAAHRVRGLLHKPAPFSPNGSQSSSTLNHSQENGTNSSTTFVDLPRPSVDSQEEHPFEHWYRGEVSRNGGVRELRVGKRQEMLEIASYRYDLFYDFSISVTLVAFITGGWRELTARGIESRDLVETGHDLRCSSTLVFVSHSDSQNRTEEDDSSSADFSTSRHTIKMTSLCNPFLSQRWTDRDSSTVLSNNDGGSSVATPIGTILLNIETQTPRTPPTTTTTTTTTSTSRLSGKPSPNVLIKSNRTGVRVRPLPSLVLSSSSHHVSKALTTTTTTNYVPSVSDDLPSQIYPANATTTATVTDTNATVSNETGSGTGTGAGVAFVGEVGKP